MARRKEPCIPDHLLDQQLAGADAQSAFAKNGLLDELKKALAERALNAEMDHHLDQGTVNLAPKRQSCRGRSRHASTHQPTRATPVASRQVRKARSRAARYSLAERR